MRLTSMGIELKSVATKIEGAGASKTRGSLSNKIAIGNDSTPKSADLVNLTMSAVNIHQAEQSLALVPVEDFAHVSKVAQAISDGAYIVDSYQVAEKIIELEKSLS